MSSFKKADGIIDSIQKQATGLRTLDGSAIEDFLSIAGYEEPAGGGGGDKYDAYNFVITQVDSATPVLEKGTWQDVYDALQNMEHVQGLFVKNITPGENHDTVCLFIPVTYTDYYSSADAIRGWGMFWGGESPASLALNWDSDGTILATLS